MQRCLSNTVMGTVAARFISSNMGSAQGNRDPTLTAPPENKPASEIRPEQQHRTQPTFFGSDQGASDKADKKGQKTSTSPSEKQPQKTEQHQLDAKKGTVKSS